MTSFEKNHSSHDYFFSLCCVCFFLLLSLWQVYFNTNPLDHIYSDMAGYIERAERLARGKSLLPYDTFYPPGTSFFYALFFGAFGKELGLRLLVPTQVLLLLASNILFSWAMLLLTKSKAIFHLTLAILSLYWPFAALASFFIAEPLFVFLANSAFLLFALMRSRKDCHRIGLALSLGLLLGLATLVKGQAHCLTLGFLLCFAFNRQQRVLIPAVCLTLFFCYALQILYNSLVLQQPSFFLSANASYNTYLGQSRREAVGCLDREGGYFYIFHNNNAGLKYRFDEPQILPVSILNREFFRQQTLALWRENPRAQIIKSAHSIIEMLEPNPRWPIRNVQLNRQLDIAFQWVTWLFVYPLALHALSGAMFFGKSRQECFLLALPPGFMLVLAALTMGQPRYFMPFLYFVFGLAAISLAQLLQALQQNHDSK